MTPAPRPRNGISPIPLALLLVLILVAAVGVAVAGPMAGLLLTLAGLAAFAAAFMPGLVLAVYLLIGTYKGDLQAYSPVDITVVLAVLNILQIIPVMLDRQSRHISRAGIALWVALALLTLGGILYAADQELAVVRVALFWALVVLPILPAALRVGSAPRFVDQFLWGIFGMGLPMVVLGLAQLSTSARLVVLGANTIEVSRAALLVPLVGIAFVLPQRRALLTAATIVLIPASLIVAIASGSRGPLLIAIALGVYGSVRLLSRPRRVNWRITGATGALILASLAVVALAGSALPEQSTQRFSLFADFLERGLSGDLNTAIGDTSSGIRVQLFGVAVSLFEERPLLGVGPAGFEALNPRFLSPLEVDVYPHNAFLQFAAEYGLVGLAIFVALLGLAVTRSLPPSSSLTAVHVLFAFWLLNAMVSGDIFGDRATWALLMLLLLIDEHRIAQVEEPETERPGRMEGVRMAATLPSPLDRTIGVGSQVLAVDPFSAVSSQPHRPSAPG